MESFGTLASMFRTNAIAACPYRISLSGLPPLPLPSLTNGWSYHSEQFILIFLTANECM